MNTKELFENITTILESHIGDCNCDIEIKCLYCTIKTDLADLEHDVKLYKFIKADESR